MSIFISVVTHGHGELIKKLDCLSLLAESYTVVVKINKPERSLIPYLKENNIKYIDESYGLGFGHNNNVVYSFCRLKLGMKDNDTFIVFNPDVVCVSDDIDKLVSLMTKDCVKLACVNLFKDDVYCCHDNSIRKFPSFLQFCKSFLGMGNTSIIDKSKIEAPIFVDWAAGSFIAFLASHYGCLKGFDEHYFMYCEDIDICYRSKKMGVPLKYYPQIRMLHLAKHANRSFFSRHFFWHISSVFRFLFSKYGLTRSKSSIV